MYLFYLSKLITLYKVQQIFVTCCIFLYNEQSAHRRNLNKNWGWGLNLWPSVTQIFWGGGTNSL